MAKWIFTDPSGATPSTYTFDVNPQTDDVPPFRKTILYENTSAPDGKALVFEGRDEVRKGKFSGVIFTEAEYNTFVSWWEKRNQIDVTDDLARERTIIIESFSPKRRRSVHFPWCHDYELTYTIVDWS